ncbi:MAG TPA: uridine kinase [Gemmatimonadota bacterium]|nr:uridine kinase [Gemmatimonadota bacterium]
MSRLVIGIAGGTGSGKTTVAQNIMKRLALDAVAVIQQDAYYHDLADLAPAQRELQNFDHPDSIEARLFASHLRGLKEGRIAAQPVYDFTAHTRKEETISIVPRDVVIAEGILLFHFPEIREILDVRIFVDTPSDIRLLRRILRDIRERGRTLESVTEQYVRTVRPMHEEFVEPSKRWADVIIPEGGHNEIAIDMVVSKVQLMQELSL